MQEEVTQRTVALCVEATRLSAGMLQQAMKKVLDEMQKGVTGHKTKLHHGKQTLRQLMKHNTGVSNIEIDVYKRQPAYKLNRRQIYFHAGIVQAAIFTEPARRFQEKRLTTK